MQPLAYIPSPSQGIWHIGPVPIRAYAIMIILGIVAAVWLGERRWAAKGGTPGVIIDVAVWAVPFGLVGGRIYHVITDYQRYFGEDGDPVRALEIWKGGLGIWGSVAFGAVGALIACRRRGISVLALADAVAPGIALAQAIGRWGNYWNQELYGRPLDAFWALEIDEDHRPTLEGGPSLDPQYADIATYHPTFLYESLWCVGVAILVIWADRRFKLTHGRAFALYVAAYTLGRAWIEALRIDDAHHILGLRLNDWTSILLFLGAVAYLYRMRHRTGPENVGGPAADGPSGEPGSAEAKPVPKDEPEPEPETEKTEAEDSETEDSETEKSEAEKSEDADKAEDADRVEDAEGADKAEDVEDAEKAGGGDAEAEAASEEKDPENEAELEAEGDDEAGDGVGEAGRVDEGEPVKDGK
ncbi:MULTISPECIES: prolipoprotein diacylglyceryl transferase [unclassified Spirillospora]|uniref:prolipoprotein diacylglyceryl transferase n=1 Tax=unclassified Spirillospora TaxID=2642701 RepID=UPI00371E2C29